MVGVCGVGRLAFIPALPHRCLMERSATKSRILSTALDLFNLEGEGEVSAVDIASVIGISPGNLYYHYRGKEPMIAELFADFEAEIRQVLGAPVTRPLAIADNWIYLYIVFEEIWDFRFFYRDPQGLVARCEGLGPKFARLLALKEKTAEALLAELERLGAVAFRNGERAALARQLAQHVTVWVNYITLREGTPPSEPNEKRKVINEGVHQALLIIAPHVQDEILFAEGLAETASNSPT